MNPSTHDLITGAVQDAIIDIKYRSYPDKNQVQFYDKDGVWLATVLWYDYDKDHRVWFGSKYPDPQDPSIVQIAESFADPNVDVFKSIVDRIRDVMNKYSEGFIQK